MGQKIVTRNPKTQTQKPKKNVAISDTIAEMFTTIPFFATYIELIPKQGPQNEELQRRARRKKFLQCEDNLLALGLDQFKGKRYERFEAIKEHLLPIFDPKQLQIRVKNCTSMLKLKYNPIAYVKSEHRVPELENEMNITVPRSKKIWNYFHEQLICCQPFRPRRIFHSQKFMHRRDNDISYRFNRCEQG